MKGLTWLKNMEKNYTIYIPIKRTSVNLNLGYRYISERQLTVQEIKHNGPAFMTYVHQLLSLVSSSLLIIA